MGWYILNQVKIYWSLNIWNRFTACFSWGLVLNTNAREKVGSVEAGLWGVPLYNFSNGYFGFVGVLSGRLYMSDKLALGSNFFTIKLQALRSAGFLPKPKQLEWFLSPGMIWPLTTNSRYLENPALNSVACGTNLKIRARITWFFLLTAILQAYSFTS